MGTSTHTPDRSVNPPDDDRYKKCTDCNGEGKIIDWEEYETEGEIDIDGKLHFNGRKTEIASDHPTKTCPTCKGEGCLEKEEGEDEW